MKMDIDNFIASIKEKENPIVSKEEAGVFLYDPDTFEEQHKLPNSFSTEKAEDVLNLIKPFKLDIFGDRKFLVCDTEDSPLDIPNNKLPATHVRKFIGKSKPKQPVDVPFCISFYDGVNAITLYSDASTGYRELKKLTPLLEDATIEKIFHNTKFDMHMLLNVGVRLFGKLHDTHTIAKIVDENRKSFALQGIAPAYGGDISLEKMVDHYKKKNKITDYADLPRDLTTEYANRDVINCYKVFVAESSLLVEQDLMRVYENECTYLVTCFAMERVGMKINTFAEKSSKDKMEKIIADLTDKIYDDGGGVFNINSSPQLHKAMLHAGVPDEAIPTTEAGNKSFKGEVLKKLKLKYDLPIIDNVLVYREASKMLKSYIKGIYEQVDAHGRVHSTIKQTEASTGRSSITDPGLQTIPKAKKPNGAVVRSMFISSTNYSLWSMDLDQVEYRGLAHYAQEEGLLQLIRDGFDVHAGTASLLFNKDIKDVTPEERDKAKTCNFAIVYGQGDDSLGVSLKLDRHRTKAFRRKYFDNLEKVEKFLKTVKAVTESRGYLRNYYGRRRRLPRNKVYKAPNALIQGWAADFLKKQANEMFKYLVSNKKRSRMVNVIHDDVVTEIHHDEEDIAPKLRNLMSDFTTFRCPITAGLKVMRENWAKGEDVEHLGYAELTDEEKHNMEECNIFDGCAYDYLEKQIQESMVN